MKTKSNIKNLLIPISVIILLINTSFAQSKGITDKQEWTGTTEQKVFGLMTVWSEAKYNFPWFDKLPDLDWDAKVTEYIPRVIAAQDIDAYYKVLMEFVTLLKDGHTNIWPPWFPFKQTDDLPAIEVQIVENKFVVARVGEIEENKNQNIYPGLEILEVDSNFPIETYFKENVLKYNTKGSPLGDQSLVWSIFIGQRGSKLSLKVKDLDGTIRNVTVTRNGIATAKPFIPRFAMWNGFEKNIEAKLLPGSIQYVRIPNFRNEGMVNEFQAMIENLDLDKTKGMIIDLRYNSGGNDRFAKQMISCLIEKSISTPLIKTPQYIPAYRAWGKEMPLLENSSLIIPRTQKKYLGPLVVLTGIATASTAEDFALEMKFSGRALLVGEKTPGSAGNPIHVTLPGGGTLRVSSFRSYYPDGTDYMHSGIEPNVQVITTKKNLADMIDPILEKGNEVIEKWSEFNKPVNKFKQSAANKIAQVLDGKSYLDAESEINSIIQNNTGYYFLEAELINLGYDFLKKNEMEKAVELFKIAVTFYPASWNAYDSYAEALMKKGENEGAIENYKKSLKLNPDNQNGKEMLKLLNDNN